MAEIFKIIGVAFITAVASVILKNTKPEIAFAVTVTGIIVILIFIVDSMENTLAIFSAIADVTGVENGLVKILLKIVGVGYLTEFGAGILNDFGSAAVADKVVLGGKIAIVFLSLPVVEGLLQMIRGFLSLV